ncbi:hypothetical protein, partial [Mycoplasma nasistruthionis]
QKGEFRNAILFGTALVLISMFSLWLIPTIVSSKEVNEQILNATIISSSIALFVQDLITFSTAFGLERKNRIPTIPIWEKIIYMLTMCLISAILLFTFIPNILGGSWSLANTIGILIYTVSLVMGFIFKFITKIMMKKSVLKQP